MRVLAIFAFGLTVLAMEASAELRVTVTGVRSEKGFIRALLFKSAEGFPEDRAKAFEEVNVPAKKGEVTLVFKGWKGGTGVVAAIHDETNAGKIRKNFLGIPQDDIAITGWNRKGRPKYERCAGVLEGSVSVPMKRF